MADAINLICTDDRMRAAFSYLQIGQDGEMDVDLALEMQVQISSDTAEFNVMSLYGPVAFYDDGKRRITVDQGGLFEDAMALAHELRHVRQDHAGLMSLVNCLPAADYITGSLLLEADAIAYQTHVACRLSSLGHPEILELMRSRNVLRQATDAYLTGRTEQWPAAACQFAAMDASARVSEFFEKYVAIAQGDYSPVASNKHTEIAHLVQGLRDLGCDGEGYPSGLFANIAKRIEASAVAVSARLDLRFPDVTASRGLEMATYHYMTSGCHVFAEALLQRLGGSVVALRDGSDDDAPVHVFCLDTDECPVDVRGCKSLSSVRGGLVNGDDLWLDRTFGREGIAASKDLDAFSEADVKQALIVIDALVLQDADFFQWRDQVKRLNEAL